jgi:hypothetical protein
MQTIEFANKSTSKNQKTETQVEESGIENIRERKGAILALSRNVYRLLETDVYYVQSERSNEIYYYVKYIFDSFSWCSCPDNSMRSTNTKCKHIFAVEYSIRKGTLRDVDKLPKEAKRDNMVPITESYRDDDYDF